VIALKGFAVTQFRQTRKTDGLEMNHDALKALLEWYAEAGVDQAVDEVALNRFMPAVAPESALVAGPESPVARLVVSQSTRQPVAEASRTPAVHSLLEPEAAISDARLRAASAEALDDLRQRLETFEGCGLKKTASRLVFGDGTPGSRVMLVGEAPGADEDREGRPFVGRSGELLEKMLAAIGLSRQAVYTANVVPWRPPGNRTPTQQETAACLPFVKRQIELVAPDILVCLGGPCAQTLLGQREGVLKLRGNWFEYRCGERVIRALVTLHPDYLLRHPLHKRLAWQDLLALKEALQTHTV
jgi:uracil-DNA glycosylase